MQHKRYHVAGALLVSVMLSACGGTLQLSEGLPTATRGIEGKSPERPAATVESATTVLEIDTGEAASSTVVPADVPVVDLPPVAPPAAVAEAATVNPELANVQLPTLDDLEARWRAMQVERVTFDPRPYVSTGYEIVWWYDPLFGQFLPIGQLEGEFTVQATFRVKGQWITALEIPYNVDGQQYGIVVPDAILNRMQDAGKGEWAEVFVYETNDIRPR